MIICGPCLFTDMSEKHEIIETSKALVGTAQVFRCKIYGGGTRPDRYIAPSDESRLEVLAQINRDILPVATEVHTPEQIYKCRFAGLRHLWIGARNCANYTLLEKIAPFPGEVYIKRGPGMTIDELIGLYKIMLEINNKKVWLIERGILTFDRLEYSRWSLDLKGLIRIKYDESDIFDRIIVDLSHSCGVRDWILPHYLATSAIGINNFMVEATISGKSKTDSNQMLSVKQLKEML